MALEARQSRALRRLTAGALVIALACLAPAPATAAPGDWATADRIDDFLTAQVADLRLPSLAVTVITDGDVSFQGTYGEIAPGSPLTRDTPFRLGSTSKQFTGLAVQQLIARGDVTLDTRVADLLPEFAAAQGWSTTTVRDLLSHRSGLSERDGLDLWSPWPAATTLRGEVTRLASVPLTRPARTAYEYTNAGYSLLGAIVERVTGESYDAALRRLVIEPLGLTASWGSVDPVGGTPAPDRYPWWGVLNLPTPVPHHPVAVPSAGTWSTAGDLTRLVQAHLGAATGVEPAVLAAAREPLGALDAYVGYASGWEVRALWELNDQDAGWQDPGLPRVWVHEGHTERSMSALEFSPELGFGLVALAGTGRGLDQDRWSWFLYDLRHTVLGTPAQPMTRDWLIVAAPALITLIPLVLLAVLVRVVATLRRPAGPGWLSLLLGALAGATALLLALVVVPSRTRQGLLDVVWMVSVPDLAVGVGLMLLLTALLLPALLVGLSRRRRGPGREAAPLTQSQDAAGRS